MDQSSTLSQILSTYQIKRKTKETHNIQEKVIIDSSFTLKSWLTHLGKAIWPLLTLNYSSIKSEQKLFKVHETLGLLSSREFT